jgi:hypothetical protein
VQAPRSIFIALTVTATAALKAPLMTLLPPACALAGGVFVDIVDYFRLHQTQAANAPADACLPFCNGRAANREPASDLLKLRGARGCGGSLQWLPAGQRQCR